jgi:hypothetical protein
MPRKAEFIFPPKRCEWPILSSLIIHEAFFEVPFRLNRVLSRTASATSAVIASLA